MATYTGDGRYNDRLDDRSIAELASENVHDHEQLLRLRSLPAHDLDEQQIISRDIMLRQLTERIRSYELKEWEMPVNQMNGFYLDLAAMYSAMPLHSAQDYRNYIARLRQVPRVFNEETAIMRLGMRDHLIEPRYLLEKVTSQAQSIAASKPETSSFAIPLSRFPATIPAAEQQQIRRDLLSAIEHDVLPAYVRFTAFMRDEYAPAGRTEPGIWSLPNGEALYRNDIQAHVQTELNPEQIFAEGMREVDAITKQMLALAASQGFSDLRNFNAHIQADPKLHGTSDQQLLTLYKHYEDQSTARLSDVVPDPPKTPLEVVPMDSFRAPTAVPADYSPGSLRGNRPGRVNVNLYKPANRLLLNVEAIAYHEGVPGHHLQFSTADTLVGIPPFRKFASFDAYSEGWALYAEQLGKELGFYQDPYSEYGRLQNEMWRAIRLVVDTGVHSKHWTREQMISFFRQHTAMDDQNIQTEVDRYIAWPGQALSYRLGQQKILSLRELARTRLGEKFDVRKYHAKVLSLGPVPLDVLDSDLRHWIDEQAALSK